MQQTDLNTDMKFLMHLARIADALEKQTKQQAAIVEELKSIAYRLEEMESTLST